MRVARGPVPATASTLRARPGAGAARPGPFAPTGPDRRFTAFYEARSGRPALFSVPLASLFNARVTSPLTQRPRDCPEANLPGLPDCVVSAGLLERAPPMSGKEAPMQRVEFEL